MTPEYAVLFMLSLALAAVGAARLAVTARIRADLRRSERAQTPASRPAAAAVPCLSRAVSQPR